MKNEPNDNDSINKNPMHFFFNSQSEKETTFLHYSLFSTLLHLWRGVCAYSC